MSVAEVVDRLTEAEEQAPHSEAAFPAQVPLSEEAIGELKAFIDSELSLAEAERAEFISNLARWQKAYAAAPSQGPKDFPLRNSSNLTMPVIKEVVNTIAAQLVITTLTNRPYWILDDLSPEWTPFIGDIERFLDIAGDRDLMLDHAAVQWILEAVKYGTSIVEVSYDVDVRQIYAYSPDGERVTKRDVIVHDGPIVYNVPLQDFICRVHETQIQKAAWVGKILRMSERELRDRVASGQFLDVLDQILPQTDESRDEVIEAHEEIQSLQPAFRETYDVYELWMSWDTDEDGRQEEIQVYYHLATRTILSLRYNPYWHGLRPFVRLVYFPVEHRFYGDGVCAQAEDLQTEISTIHNQRIDNATMANLKMIVKRRMERGLMPGDPLYTGKIIEVNDMQGIREFQLSEIYPSTVTNEELSRRIVERVTGVSEASLGRAMPVTRTTATAQLALLQEQAKRFDLTVRGIRAGMTEIAKFTLSLYFQFGTGNKARAWMGERGKVVEAVFRLPRRVFEIGIGIRASSPTSQLNKQIQRENNLALFNLMVQMYERIIQLTAQIAPQAILPVAHGLVSAARKFMFRVLAAFDETDPEEMLAGLAVLERVLPSPEDFGGMEADRRAEESVEVLDQLARLETLLRETTGAEARFPRLAPIGGDGAGVERAEGLSLGGGSGPGPSR